MTWTHFCTSCAYFFPYTGNQAGTIFGCPQCGIQLLLEPGESVGSTAGASLTMAIPMATAVAERLEWFHRYTESLGTRSTILASVPGHLYTCPCCQVLTLSERGSYVICDECGWEDDGQDELDSETVRGGPNGNLSLSAARSNYLLFGASSWSRKTRCVGL